MSIFNDCLLFCPKPFLFQAHFIQVIFLGHGTTKGQDNNISLFSVLAIIFMLLFLSPGFCLFICFPFSWVSLRNPGHPGTEFVGQADSDR